MAPKKKPAQVKAKAKKVVTKAAVKVKRKPAASKAASKARKVVAPTKPIRIGFLIGKDTDLVEDPKYVGDASFMADMPDKYRVDPESKEYLKNCEAGVKGFAHADVAIPWYIHKKYGGDVKVDMIFPEEITLKRLKSNMCNYIIGYDVINSIFEGPKRYKKVTKVFTECGNLMPSWEVQDFIYIKSRYMQACMDAGIPMAPTIFAKKNKRSPAKLLAEIKARGWQTFVMKQSMMAFSLGFCKLKVEDCEKDPSILKNYFRDYAECPEYVVQEAIEGFTRNWETRVFWFNGKFLYAIANKAAVSTEDGQEVIITGDDIPSEFLENAKRIGEQALKILPQLCTPSGQPVDMTLIRTDVGCSDSPVHDKHTKWDPNGRTFFLNEIEYGGTTYFIRHLKEDVRSGSLASLAVPSALSQVSQVPRNHLRRQSKQGNFRKAWAPGLDSLTEGRFIAGFQVYLAHREQWFEQWWLAKSGGTSARPPSHRLMSELRKDDETVGFDQFREFCGSLAEESNYVPPPASFLRSVWQDSGQTYVDRLPDAAYDALVDAYASHWRFWLEDWIAEREVSSMPAKQEDSEEVKAAVTVQRHFRAYKARRRVDKKKSEVLLSDLVQTMSNKAAAAKLFERFDSGRKDFWTAEDMARFCAELWQQQDNAPPPPAAFGADAMKKVRALAGTRPKKVLAKMSEEEEVFLTREEFRRGLLTWNDRRHRQLKKWERARYCEVYACPCCRGRFRVVAVPVPSEGYSLEIAKVIDEGMVQGVTSLTGVKDPPRFPLPGRLAAPGSAARKLPHPSEVAFLHSEVSKAVAAGAALCVLPPGCARPALAGRLLLEAAVAGASRGAPVLLLAQDGEMDAVQLWIQSASPGCPVTRFSPQEPSRWQESICKVSGKEIPRLLMATPQLFQGLVLEKKASAKDVDFVLMSCSQDEVPLLKECELEEAPFTIESPRPRLVCLLDSTSQTHEALLQHLEALEEAKGHMSSALKHLEVARSLHGQPGGFAQASLEDFSRRVARFPTAARPTDIDPEDVPEALPLGFTGPLQKLKRRPVVPAFQDNLSSESETPSSSASPSKAAAGKPPDPGTARPLAPAPSTAPKAKAAPQSFF
ncbi:unnamed protein product [Symbiodinium sp. CCMP2456]|nr:unnamed protein product [Symbiodinium sp. CCMP2456]